MNSVDLESTDSVEFSKKKRILVEKLTVFKSAISCGKRPASYFSARKTQDSGNREDL